ncbi:MULTISPECIES: hypothetical protein [Holospora]|uniref:Uncharacterized protein n=2 Tax=Holospora TaxID=44747 RepID=A0A061JHB7_9PROT|nr:MULTISPECIES: hypothetical protein [Holospora]ETZ04628.1 hypothetical protein K737_300948 [Holospora undulata HU1]GAJ46576.1 hypothetical protein HE1_00911 [Holospora elegans E1]
MVYFFWLSHENEAFSFSEHGKIDRNIIFLSFRQEEEKPGELILHLPLDTPVKAYGVLSWMPKNQQNARCLFKGCVDQIHQENGITVVHLKAVQDHNSWNCLAQNFRAKETFCNYFFDDQDMRPESVLADQLLIPYWCPVSGKCKISHITNSENIFQAKGDIHITQYRQNPGISQVKISLSAQWIQQVQGMIDVFPWIERTFPNKNVATYTPDSLKKIWPKPGTLLGNSGYRVVHSELIFNQRKSEFLKLSTSDRIVQRHVFDGSLWLFWNLKQKRKENIQTLWTSSVPGESTELHWNLGAITSAQAIDGWSPNRAYKKGDCVRFGQKIFECLCDHHSFVFNEKLHWKLHDEHTQLLFSAIQSSFFLTCSGKKAFDFALQRAYKIWLKAARCCHLELKGTLDSLGGINLDHQVCIEYPKNCIFSGKVTQYTLIAEQGTCTITIVVSGLHSSAFFSSENSKAFDHSFPSCAYAENYSPQWYQDPEKKEGKEGSQYFAYDHVTPQDSYAQGQFFTGNQLVERIDVLGSDKDQLYSLESLSNGSSEKPFLRPTAIRMHFRKLKGLDSLQHKIFVRMLQGLSVKI